LSRCPTFGDGAQFCLWSTSGSAEAIAAINASVPVFEEAGYTESGPARAVNIGERMVGSGRVNL
jgi:hypothetical protein